MRKVGLTGHKQMPSNITNHGDQVPTEPSQLPMEGKRKKEGLRKRVSRQKSCIGLGLWWLPQSAQGNKRETGSYTEVPVTLSSKTRSQMS